MDLKIDYLSFTIPSDTAQTGQGRDIVRHVGKLIGRTTGREFWTWLNTQDETFGQGRGHYGNRLYFRETHSVVWWGGTANHILIELPGTACQALRDVGHLMPLLERVANRATRLDLACDVVDGEEPSVFVKQRVPGRFKGDAHINSETGKTEYVGSTKSSRYARVYMYDPPHPRAGILRIEHVLRDDYAKAGARVILNDGLIELAGQLGNTFGWQSANWSILGATEGKLKAERHDRHGDGTLKWIHDAVIPALVRAHKDGLLTVGDFGELLAEALAKGGLD